MKLFYKKHWHFSNHYQNGSFEYLYIIRMIQCLKEQFQRSKEPFQCSLNVIKFEGRCQPQISLGILLRKFLRMFVSY
jgi:hypothetical protein